MAKLFFIFFICVLFFMPFARAQNTLWDGGKDKMQQVKAKGSRSVSKVKQWKKHIEDWGLDSNYNHSFSLSARLNTNGWSGGGVYMKQKSPGKKIVWQLHFSEIRQEKETRLEGTGKTYANLGKYTPFIFGKINNAYTLQLAYGREQLLLPGLLDGNLSVSLRYTAGPALALLKPYYLNLVYVDYIPEEKAYLRTEKYSGANAGQFLKPGAILGNAGWTKGLGEMKYIPGLFAELAVVVSPDKNKSFVQTITIGGNAAFYTSKIEIMAERKAYPYQASFFVGLAMGKRWK